MQWQICKSKSSANFLTCEIVHMNCAWINVYCKARPGQSREMYCKVGGGRADGISFAKQAAAVNATVSDIYRRQEGRQGEGRGGGGEIVFELKLKPHLAPSRYFCLSYCSHPTISWWGGEDYFFFNLKNPPLPLFLCHPILYYARTPTISDEGLLVIGILQAWLCKKFVDKYFNIFYFMQ